MTASASTDHEDHRVRHAVEGVIVHALGKLTAAEHVYARDRIAQLRSLGRGGDIRGTVMIVKPAIPDAIVLASAGVEIDGKSWRARAEARTVNLAVDGLRQELHDRIVEAHLGPDT